MGLKIPWNTGPKNPYRFHGTSVPTCPKGIWLSQRFVSRDCPSDIFPSPKRPRRISPNPGPKSRDSCPGTQISWDSRPIAHPCFRVKVFFLIWFYNIPWEITVNRWRHCKKVFKKVRKFHFSRIEFLNNDLSLMISIKLTLPMIIRWIIKYNFNTFHSNEFSKKIINCHLCSSATFRWYIILEKD